jgi:L-alanine-DL-glutamate epimerase-like enolase superfamily enzyme
MTRTGLASADGCAITDLRLTIFRAAPLKPIRVSFGGMTLRQTSVLEIICADGRIGLAESWVNYPVWAPFERQAAFGEAVRPLLVDADSSDVAGLTDLALRRLLPYGRQAGNPGTVYQIVSAIDMALHDLAAQRAGLSLAAFLGAGGASAPVYASGLDSSAEDREIVALRERGHTRFKFKCGFDHDGDVAALGRFRALLGSDAMIMIDANQAYGVDEAIRFGRAVAPLGIAWFEEPIDTHDLAGMRRVREATGLRVAAGENFYGTAAACEAVRTGAIDIIQPDLAKTGGIRTALEIARVARECGVEMAYHNFASAVGVVASIHLSAGATQGSLVEIDATGSVLMDQLLAAPLVIENGSMVLPSGIGLGIHIAAPAMAKWALPSSQHDGT